MEVRNLTLTNFRGYEQASFDFKPGINLIAGKNGVGKSSALDALRIAFSHVTKKMGVSRETASKLLATDVREGQPSARISASFTFLERSFQFDCNQFRDKYVVDRPGEVRSQLKHQKSSYEVRGDYHVSDDEPRPLAMYFGPHRSLYEPKVRKSDAVTGVPAVYRDALVERPARLNYFAQWMIAMSNRGQVVDQVQNAVTDFLPLLVPTAAGDERASLFIRKRVGGDGSDSNAILIGEQLSDGERGLLAMVMDLSRRLVLANPSSRSPLSEGRACVLIDEIELHLHPELQRDTIDQLRETFKSSQFIITTHSPQVIGEVQAANVNLLTPEWKIEHTAQTLGMDSAWILRHVMHAPDRDRDSANEIAGVKRLIEEKRPDEALVKIAEIEDKIGSFEVLQGLRTKAELMIRLKN